MKYSKTHIIITVIGLAILVGLIIYLVIEFIPLIEEIIKNTGEESEASNYIEKYGVEGIPVLVLIQALVVILTVIPAAAIQIIAGLCYGIWLGTLICIVGIVMGNALVFFALREFKNVLAPVISKKNYDNEKKKNKLISVDTINKMKHPEYLAFAIYLIPFIPNGILPYIFAQSKITFPKFLLGITAASIPTVLLCSLLGDQLADKNFLTVIIITACMIIIFGIMMIFRKKITEKVKSLKL